MNNKELIKNRFHVAIFFGFLAVAIALLLNFLFNSPQPALYYCNWFLFGNSFSLLMDVISLARNSVE